MRHDEQLAIIWKSLHELESDIDPKRLAYARAAARNVLNAQINGAIHDGGLRAAETLEQQGALKWP